MKKSKSAALIVFQKSFIPGTVKTRLANTIGDEKALAVYKKLVRITYDQIPTDLLEILIWFTPAIEKLNHPLHENASFYVQKGDELGSRMANSFISAFKSEFEKVLIIGTDCPFITADIYRKAIEMLAYNDYVIGPAKDGGYYMLGAKESPGNILNNIAWGTDSVLRSTLQSIEREGRTYSLLEELTDIDDEEDLKEFEAIFTKQ